MIASHVPALTRPSRHHLALATAATGLAAVIAVTAVSMAGPARAAGPPDVGLGTAAQFAVLAGDGITNTGTTTVTGDVGSFATRTVTDNGAINPPANVRRDPTDLVVPAAKLDLRTGYTQAAGAQTNTTVLSASDIGGQTLVGGTYNRAASLNFTGTLTLDGENDPNSVFIIQVGADFTTATGAQVLLTRGAQACHVYWQIGNDAVIEVDTAFKGNILAGNDISAKTRATFEGRLLSNDGAVTLDTNTITLPTCAAATTPPPTTATTAPVTPAPTATTRPTPRPTRSTDSSDGGSSDGDGGSSDGSDSDSDGSDGGAGDSDAAGGDSYADGGTSSSATGIPDAGGPPMYLAPVGVLAVLAGAGLVAASRRRQHGAHRG